MDELVGSYDIAQRLGMNHGEDVHRFLRSDPTFPKPVAEIGGPRLKTKVWSWPDVEAWALRVGKLPRQKPPAAPSPTEAEEAALPGLPYEVLSAIVEQLPGTALFMVDAGGHPSYANQAARRLLGRGADPHVSVKELAKAYGLYVADTDELYPAHRLPLVRALQGDTVMAADLELRTGGARVPVEMWVAPLRGADGVVVGAVSAFRDISERRRSERGLEALREVLSAILANGRPADMLALVAARARELSGADVATVAQPSVGADSLTIVVADGLGADVLAGETVPLEGSLMGDALSSGHTLTVASVSEENRGLGPLVSAGIGPALFIPLVAGGRALGVVALGRCLGQPAFDERDAEFAETFAAKAALALEFARVQGRLAEAAVSADRERTARDLHDRVVQGLVQIGRRLGTAAGRADDAGLVAAQLGAAREELSAAVGELRASIFSLTSTTLASSGLAQALQDLAAASSSATGVATTAEVDGELAAELASVSCQLEPFLREALSNVRHAGATTCCIRLARAAGRAAAVLEVVDDGRGFDASEAAKGNGHGLVNLKARAAAAGGRLEVESVAGSGTTVRLVLNLASGTATPPIGVERVDA